jgi:hypothetical protein
MNGLFRPCTSMMVEEAIRAAGALQSYELAIISITPAPPLCRFRIRSGAQAAAKLLLEDAGIGVSEALCRSVGRRCIDRISG